jgi:phosphopantetheinyl transferase
MAVHVIHRQTRRSELRRRWSGDAGVAWLSAAEREMHAVLSDSGRREAWLFGRLLAKQAILEEMMFLTDEGGHIAPSDIQIHSRDGLGRPTRPRVFVHGRARPWSLSIAHSECSVLVALCAHPDWTVGVDLTPAQPLSDTFVETWFTPWERNGPGSRNDRRPSDLWAELWAVKEAAYKALNTGERFAPRRLEVRVRAGGGFDLRYDGSATSGSKVQVLEVETEFAAMVSVRAKSEGWP